MKFRMWFRLVIKAVGLLLLSQAVPGLVRVAVIALDESMNYGYTGFWRAQHWPYALQPLSEQGVLIAFGLYLLFGGKWLLNRCVPIDKFCSECGYNISKVKSGRCPECGASFSAAAISKVSL